MFVKGLRRIRRIREFSDQAIHDRQIALQKSAMDPFGESVGSVKSRTRQFTMARSHPKYQQWTLSANLSDPSIHDARSHPRNRQWALSRLGNCQLNTVVKWDTTSRQSISNGPFPGWAAVSFAISILVRKFFCSVGRMTPNALFKWDKASRQLSTHGKNYLFASPVPNAIVHPIEFLSLFPYLPDVLIRGIDSVRNGAPPTSIACGAYYSSDGTYIVFSRCAVNTLIPATRTNEPGHRG